MRQNNNAAHHVFSSSITGIKTYQPSFKNNLQKRYLEYEK